MTQMINSSDIIMEWIFIVLPPFDATDARARSHLYDANPDLCLMKQSSGDNIQNEILHPWPLEKKIPQFIS